jgi:hypothetical protein
MSESADTEYRAEAWRIMADLAAHDREVAAKALEDAANWMQLGIGEPWNPDDEELLRKHWSARRKYLYDRAARIREGQD